MHYNINGHLKVSKYSLEAEHDIVDYSFEHFLTAACERISDLTLFECVLFKLLKANLAVNDILTDTRCP